jgi:hypothetical protein
MRERERKERESWKEREIDGKSEREREREKERWKERWKERESSAHLLKVECTLGLCLRARIKQ